MSAVGPSLPTPAIGRHPLVVSRRRRERLRAVIAALAALIAGIGISALVGSSNVLLLVGGLIGLTAIVVLCANPRLEVSVLLVALYLGLLDGPVKLAVAHTVGSGLREVLILCVAVGALLRLLAKRQKIVLPPLSPWALGFTGAVLIEVVNPRTGGILKSVGGVYQELGWVPFFFFGYGIMRTKSRFRRAFIVLGVIALANGVVNTYQSRLSPGQLASWGPGYKNLVYGTATAGQKGITGRTYSVEGEARVRPPGLGSDEGFGAGTGTLALPAILALIATTRGRRRWTFAPLALGALAAVATGAGRIEVVGAVLAVLAFAVFSLSAGRRVTKALTALLIVLVLAIPLGAVFVSALGSGTFARYASLTSGSSKDTKTTSIAKLPSQLALAPFGLGLGTVGAAGGFGGGQHTQLEGHGVSAETEYNFIADELGILGLLMFVGLGLRVIFLAATRLRRVRDVELRIYLSAVFASYTAFMITGFAGPTTTAANFGPFYWFAGGIAAYWLAGRSNRFRGAMEAVAP